MTEREWRETIVEEVMAHKQSDDKYHWTACICCGRALYDLAPKLVAEARRRALEEAEGVVSKQRDEYDWEKDAEVGVYRLLNDTLARLEDLKKK